MDEYVILIRHSNRGVIALMDDTMEMLAVFPDRDAAEECADEHALCQAWPYQVVELEV